MVLANVKGWLEKNGVRPRDVPIALLSFKAMAFGTCVGLTIFTVRYRPLNRFFRSGRPQAWVQRMKLRYPKMEEKISSISERIADHRITQWSLGHYQRIRQEATESAKHFERRKRRELGFGVAEGYILYKITLPFWSVAYLYSLLMVYSDRDGMMENISASFDGSNDSQDIDPVTSGITDTINDIFQIGKTTSETTNNNNPRSIHSENTQQN
eukprot:UN32138